MIKQVVRKTRGIIKKLARHRREYLISHRKGKKAEMAVCDILDCNSGEYSRDDVFVRYLAVSSYKNGDEKGMDLYRRMQKERKSETWAEKAVEIFKKLIRSYDMDGYHSDSRILLDRNLRLIDGSHRLAMALYYEIHNISALILPIDFQAQDYSFAWFLMKGFSKSEIEEIIACRNMQLEKIRSPFSCIIWAPAVPFLSEIAEDAGFFGEVSNIRRYHMSKDRYHELVRAVYAIDDIEEWKIEKKLEHMEPYDSELVSFDLLLRNPAYRIKKKTGLPISTVGEKIKKTIRTKYSGRIDDYFFDILFHTADNTYQSNMMRAILDQYTDTLTETDIS